MALRHTSGRPHFCPTSGTPAMQRPATQLPPLCRRAWGAAVVSQPAIQQLVSLRGWAAPPGGGAGSGGAAAPGGARRGMWGEPPSREEVAHRDSFYDNVIETWATKVGPEGWLVDSAGGATSSGGGQQGCAACNTGLVPEQHMALEHAAQRLLAVLRLAYPRRRQPSGATHAGLNPQTRPSRPWLACAAPSLRSPCVSSRCASCSTLAGMRGVCVWAGVACGWPAAAKHRAGMRRRDAPCCPCCPLSPLCPAACASLPRRYDPSRVLDSARFVQVCSCSGWQGAEGPSGPGQHCFASLQPSQLGLSP